MDVHLEAALSLMGCHSSTSQPSLMAHDLGARTVSSSWEPRPLASDWKGTIPSRLATTIAAAPWTDIGRPATMIAAAAPPGSPSGTSTLPPAEPKAASDYKHYLDVGATPCASGWPATYGGALSGSLPYSRHSPSAGSHPGSSKFQSAQAVWYEHPGRGPNTAAGAFGDQGASAADGGVSAWRPGSAAACPAGHWVVTSGDGLGSTFTSSLDGDGQQQQKGQQQVQQQQKGQQQKGQQQKGQRQEQLQQQKGQQKGQQQQGQQKGQQLQGEQQPLVDRAASFDNALCNASQPSKLVTIVSMESMQKAFGTRSRGQGASSGSKRSRADPSATKRIRMDPTGSMRLTLEVDPVDLSCQPCGHPNPLLQRSTASFSSVAVPQGSGCTSPLLCEAASLGGVRSFQSSRNNVQMPSYASAPCHAGATPQASGDLCSSPLPQPDDSLFKILNASFNSYKIVKAAQSCHVGTHGGPAACAAPHFCDLAGNKYESAELQQYSPAVQQEYSLFSPCLPASPEGPSASKGDVPPGWAQVRTAAKPQGISSFPAAAVSRVPHFRSQASCPVFTPGGDPAALQASYSALSQEAGSHEALTHADAGGDLGAASPRHAWDLPGSWPVLEPHGGSEFPLDIEELFQASPMSSPRLRSKPASFGSYSP